MPNSARRATPAGRDYEKSMSPATVNSRLDRPRAGRGGDLGPNLGVPADRGHASCGRPIDRYHGRMDIEVAADFPKVDYLEVEQRLSKYLGKRQVDTGTVPDFSGYVGGWNAVVLRFRAADEDCSMAATSLARDQNGLTAEDRYQQERPLLGFFVHAQSAVESCCFAIYHIARMRKAGSFGRTKRRESRYHPF